MTQMLWLVPALPLLGFLLLSLVGRFLPKTMTSVVGVGTVGLSMLLSFWIGIEFLNAPLPVDMVLWDWICVATFSSHIGLYLDKLSLVMIAVVTTISFLVLLYSVGYMAKDAGYSRFFAYMNLFVGAMLVLVLSDNLLCLYLGWEGVGLCSYLLIGFWYEDLANGRAANKAFIITRIGDISFLLGLFVLFGQFGTLQLPQILAMAPQAGIAAVVPLLLLGGAVGKSAQLPLQTWLPDAMAGPTPVSALIHAATMVTAGVYLLARTHVLFDLVPNVQLLTAVIGAATLLLAGCSALAQHDIKRVLAYSTMSQVGFMFLALGVGAHDAAVFHLMTHAFFKSLLFLGAGVVIISLGQEHNMFNMGGLRTELPLTFWTFLAGAAALSAIPWIDAGFYSKDLILAASMKYTCLYVFGLIGSFLTALYTFRMVFLTFFGPCQQKIRCQPVRCMAIPLVLLAAGALGSGLINIPQWLGTKESVTLPLLQTLVPLAGIGVAALFFWLRPHLVPRWETIPRWSASGWGFDSLYNHLIVKPFVLFFRWNKDDAVDALPSCVASACAFGNGVLGRLQNGKTRWYAMTMTVGAIVLISMMVWT